MANAGEYNWAEKRVLVTGGAGFLGSALVWALSQRGCGQIVVVDFAPTPAKKRNLEPLRFESFIEPEELLREAAAGYLKHFDVVFHLGACSSTTETNAEYLRRNNYEYTRTLAAEALMADARFVYASSAATYGNGSAGMDDRSNESLEKLKPLNLYGESKQMFDLEAYRKGWLKRIVGLKYFNVFGPNEDHKGDMRSVVNKSYAQIRETGVMRLFKSYRPEFADGEQKRDFLYVKDAMEMTLFLAANSKVNGLFNIGSGTAHSWNELADAVFAAMNLPKNVEYIEMPVEIRDKYQYFTQANIAKLRDAGYVQQITSLNDAVEDYVTAFLAKGKTLGA